ncbi:MAG: alkaline phosphatase [Micromonosporaceae bacterium]|nr:alkaline phosphatase [Micromonosporaceae bacterium]
MAATIAATTLIAVPASAMAAAKGTDRSRDARNAINGGKARSIILLIGDGMGDSEITIARNYQVGAAGRLALDSLPLTGAMTTYSVRKDNPSQPDYVTDSAAAGTAIATGHKTNDGAISVLPDGSAVPTIMELAKKAGYRTGNVSTAELQDATPAVFTTHVVDRDCKGPQSMGDCPFGTLASGGAGSISEQLIASNTDVQLGGGRKYFNQTTTVSTSQQATVLSQAESDGYQVVTDATALASVPATTNQKVLGVFADGNLDPEWTGPVATASGTAPATCTVNPARSASQPHLADMTAKAIALLDRASRKSKKGFFLHVEGASIDKLEHSADPCGHIGETVAFDAAVAKALDYQRTHPDTLVIVTADHGHTAQIVETGSISAGATATVLTRDGVGMTISYGTAPVGKSQQHTGTQLRIAAKGPQAANVLGVIDSTDLFDAMAQALGVRR